MARYEMIDKYGKIDDKGNVFILKNDISNFKEFVLISLNEEDINEENRVCKNDVYYDISPYLNKYDVFDSIATNLIDINKDKEYINTLVNEDYLNFDLCFKLYTNDIRCNLPERYDILDFENIININNVGEYRNKLLDKYKDTINKEQDLYILEEKRCLLANKERVCSLIENSINELANLVNNRNDIDEKVRKLK